METNHFVGGRIWSFGVMGFDDSSGQIALDSASRLRHTHNPCRAEPFHAARLKRLRELASACGARLLHLPSRGALQTPYTVHPLGGAAMADSPQRGVVDSDGQVFGYPGLYVADGSILPTPIGCAPSMTIAALAERISEHLIAHA
jgi:cholesterol oxidase